MEAHAASGAFTPVIPTRGRWVAARLWVAVLLLWCPAVVAGGPNAELRQALLDSARVVLREGEGLMRLGQAAGPEAATFREEGQRLVEQAETMTAAAEGLSAQTEQAARSVRRESAALRGLAERMLTGGDPLLGVARRLLVESERLKTAASEAPVVEPQEPFEGLATGVSKI